LQKNEGFTRLIGLAVLQARQGQGFLGEGVQRAIVLGQGRQPRLQIGQGRRIHHQEGGLEGWRVRKDWIARCLGRLVKQANRIRNLVGADRQPRLLLQGHDLIGAVAFLGRFFEGGARIDGLVGPQGLHAAIIGLGSLGGLARVQAVPAPPAQGGDKGNHQNGAHDGQPGAGQALVPVGAKLLLDLFEDINHGNVAPKSQKANRRGP